MTSKTDSLKCWVNDCNNIPSQDYLICKRHLSILRGLGKTPILPEGVHCCMCKGIPDLYCQINNVNGEKGFMAWYCAYHLRLKLQQYARIIPNIYPHYYKVKDRLTTKRGNGT